MISIKGKVEIEVMKRGGEILSEVLIEVLKNARAGVSELDLDKLAEELIEKKGGRPGFKKVKGYKHSICVSTNNVVVHGIPSDRVLEEGDIIGIDCGVFYKGYHTDMAETMRVEGLLGASSSLALENSSPTLERFGSSNIQVSRESKSPRSQNADLHKFLEVGKRALFEGIRQARAENRVGHISQAIQEVVEGAGYSVVRSLVGHGVGRQLHEDPEVPGFLNRKIEETPPLKPGMTLAIEVIYNMGKPEVEYTGGDDWTIVTADGSLSGLFERTVLVTEKDPELLTYLEEDGASTVAL